MAAPTPTAARGRALSRGGDGRAATAGGEVASGHPPRLGVGEGAPAPSAERGTSSLVGVSVAIHRVQVERESPRCGAWAEPKGEGRNVCNLLYN